MAPHLLNPRVPLAVSHMCMKMLAEWPAERYATVPELCSALQGALTQAENDATWEVPLVDPHDPQVTTTLDDPGLQEPNEVLRAFRKSGKQQPRRGLVRPKKALDLLLARSPEESPRAPIPEVEQDRIPTVGAPREAGKPAAEHEPPGEAGKPAPSASVPPAREQLAPPVAARFSRAPWRLGLVAALATVSVVGLSVSAGLWGLGLSSHTGKGGPELTRPSMSPPHGSAGGVVDGHEVAPASKPLESFPGEGAAPAGALPPAPTANAMPRTPTETKKNETQTQRAGLRLPVKPATVAAAAVAGCTLAAGCTGSTTQVRPEPPVISCPQDWRETHKRFNVTGRGETATVKGYKAEPGEAARVKDGPVTLYVGKVGGFGFGYVGDFPDGTLLLGTWKLGDDRLFGTFTEAKVPGEGTLPVCLVAGIEGGSLGFQGAAYWDERGKEFLCPPGLGVCLTPGSTPGNAKTPTRVVLEEPAGQP